MVNNHPKNGKGYVNGSSRSAKLNAGATLRITWTEADDCWLDGLQIKDASGNILASYDSEALSTMDQVTMTMPKKNVKVVFDFERDGPEPFSVTTRVSPGGVARVDVWGEISGSGNSYTALDGAAIEIEADIINESYVFDHFVINGTTYTEPYLSYTVTQDTTITAYFTKYVSPHSVTVTVDPSGGGDCSLTGDADSLGDGIHYTCENNGTVTAHATEGEYYKFKYFLINGTKYTSNPCSYTVKKDTTIKAVFVYDLFSIHTSVTPSEGGFVSVSKDAARSGQTVSVSISPSSGYMLDSWSVSGTGAKKIDDSSFTVGTSDVTVKVKFKAKPMPTDHAISVKISPSDGGYVSVPSSAQDDETVPVSISPAPGYKLKNWTVSGGGATKLNESSFRMGTANAKVTVTFEKEKYTVSASGCTAKPTSGVTGTQVTLKFYLPDNSSFIAELSDSDGSIPYSIKKGKVDSSGGMTITLTFKIRTSNVTATIHIVS